MFDIGGWEFLVIIVIAIIVIGPKDLPGTIRTISGWVRKARELAREFQSGLEDLTRETEIDSVRNDIEAGLGLDEMKDAGNSIRRDIEQAVDPDKEIAGTFSEDDPFGDSDFGGEEDLDDYGPPEEGADDEAEHEALAPRQPTPDSAEAIPDPPADAPEKA